MPDTDDDTIDCSAPNCTTEFTKEETHSTIEMQIAEEKIPNYENSGTYHHTLCPACTMSVKGFINNLNN